jgi:hypothetical protein
MTKARSNAVANAAKGDLTVGNGTNLSGILAVGSNGDTLVADSSASVGIRYQANFAAGKNKIINGDFNIWQRGTSFLYNGGYTADRYAAFSDAGGTVSQQTFTPGTAPVAGYEGQFFIRLAKSAGGSFGNLVHKIEDVRTFAGQTITYSFWAKAGSAQTFNLRLTQNFGSGGSGSVILTEQTVSVTTSWARYSAVFAIPSVSGKTIGTSSFLEIQPYWLTASALSVDIWGVQVEAGSTATAFQTATGTIQGELAACQRYYWRNTTGSAYGVVGTAFVATSTTINALFTFPVQMRVTPTAIEQGNLEYIDYSFGSGALSSPSFSPTESTPLTARCNFTVSGATAGRGAFIRASNNTAAFVGFTSEL